jgi:hypothetical protein
MSGTERGVRWLQVVAVFLAVCLFVADYVFDVLAKQPPNWVYWVLGLLGIGVEGPALRRLLIDALKAFARIPPDRNQD